MSQRTEQFLKTKILCTIGPASRHPEVLLALCAAGMDVARLNMSHSTPDEVRAAAQAVRECGDSLGRPIAVLIDLQGPKMRLGDLPAALTVDVGDRVVLAPAGLASGSELPVSYQELSTDVSTGDRILLNDGQVELAVKLSRHVHRVLTRHRVHDQEQFLGR